MLIFLDVETIPGQTEEARRAASEGIRPPGNLKKAETIAAWWANEAAAAERTAWHRQALDGGTQGEIVSIAVCSDTGGEWVRCRAAEHSEAELLRQFFDEVESWLKAEGAKAGDSPSAWPLQAWPVAHNAAFDLGYLWRRATVHGIPRPSWLPAPLARSGKEYGCTMTTWAGFRGTVSLDALCRALGLESPKGDMTGADVFDAWQAAQYGTIAAYNMADAKAVAAVWQRLQGWGP